MINLKKREQQRIKTQKWREKNRKKYNDYMTKWRKENHEKYSRYRSEYEKKNSVERGKGRLARYHKCRLRVLEHYGNKCACCGEKELRFLTIDHMKGNGNKHRKEIKTNIVHWLEKNNYPKGFQVLCYNCNCAKGFWGKCPHAK